MKTDLHTKIALKLFDLQAEMTLFNLWSDKPPPAEAMASQQPFCIDTMDFTEWLQFIFIEKIRQAIELGQPLPEKCNITPMAEEFFKCKQIDCTSIIKLLRQIDDLLSNNLDNSYNNQHIDKKLLN